MGFAKKLNILHKLIFFSSRKSALKKSYNVCTYLYNALMWGSTGTLNIFLKNILQKDMKTPPLAKK